MTEYTDADLVNIIKAECAGERERIAKMVDDFHWILPVFKDAAQNDVSDDAAEAVKEQIAAAIRAGGTALNPLSR